MRLIFTTSGIYLVYLVAMFFLENDYKLFLPVIFLLLSLGASYLVNEGRALKRALLLTVAANLAFNALYAALPAVIDGLQLPCQFGHLGIELRQALILARH